MTPLTTRFMALALLGFALTACGVLGARTIEGSGTAAQQTRDVSGFTEVSFSVPGALVIEQGATEGLHIEADDNILEHLEVRVRNGRLEIRVESGVTLRPVTPLRFELHVPELTLLNLAGGGEVEVREFQADALTVRVAGSGAVTTPDLWAGDLKIEVAGSGSFAGWGSVERQDINIAGSGAVDVADMESGEARVDIAGSGTIRLQARDELNARIAGSGSVRYTGDPTVNTSIAGSGSVSRAN